MKHLLLFLTFIFSTTFGMQTNEKKLPWESFAEAIIQDKVISMEEDLRTCHITSDQLWNAAFLAVGNHANACLIKLLEYPIAINYQDDVDKLTLLHAAVIMSNDAAVDMLLRKGASIHLRCRKSFDAKTVAGLVADIIDYRRFTSSSLKIVKLIQQIQKDELKPVESTPLSTYFKRSELVQKEQKPCYEFCSLT